MNKQYGTCIKCWFKKVYKREEWSLLFDLFKAFVLIKLSHKSDFFG